MKKSDTFNLINEMLETSDIIRNFDFAQTNAMAEAVRETGRIFMSGEGSSRIFPAKNFIDEAFRAGADVTTATAGSYQAMEYDLSKYAVFASSNSGRTKETLTLVRQLRAEGHNRVYGVTANAGTPIADESVSSIVLACGQEKAVAATKSVVEQALVYRAILSALTGDDAAAQRGAAADFATEIMSATYDDAMVSRIANARMFFFAGRNDGVAEELTLKTNEIVRKPSAFLEGTYALHGVEEIVSKDDVMIFVNPFPTEFGNMKSIFEDKIGATVVCIAAFDTPFHTIKIPSLANYDGILQLVAGWNLLVHIGLALGINLDKPERARKIGNVME